ncbi:MAG: LiaF domain-containing protein [Patescibacteria group bacterium]|jgi:hypothetical protein
MALIKGNFVGVLLILVGILLVMRNIFGFDVPVAGILISLFLIIWGSSILIGTRNKGSEITFGEGEIRANDRQNKYEIVFGKGVVDLRKINLSGDKREIQVDVVFGGAEVRIRQDVPIRINASGAFGAIRLPDGSTAAFGERIYTTNAYKEGEPYVLLRISTAFGGIEVNAE